MFHICFRESFQLQIWNTLRRSENQQDLRLEALAILEQGLSSRVSRWPKRKLRTRSRVHLLRGRSTLTTMLFFRCMFYSVALKVI